MRFGGRSEFAARAWSGGSLRISPPISALSSRISTHARAQVRRQARRHEDCAVGISAGVAHLVSGSRAPARACSERMCVKARMQMHAFRHVSLCLCDVCLALGVLVCSLRFASCRLGLSRLAEQICANRSASKARSPASDGAARMTQSAQSRFEGAAVYGHRSGGTRLCVSRACLGASRRAAQPP